MATGIFETLEGAKRTGSGGLDQKVMDLLEAGNKRTAGLIVASVDEDSAREEAGPVEEKKGPEAELSGDWSLSSYHF